jgi:hypothetical protein
VGGIKGKQAPFVSVFQGLEAELPGSLVSQMKEVRKVDCCQHSPRAGPSLSQPCRGSPLRTLNSGSEEEGWKCH